MKRKRIIQDHLNDIVDAIVKIHHFVEGMEFADFRTDDKTVFAVIRALEIIGEASKKVPKQYKEKFQDIPWRGMSGIRDKLIHEYFGVNLEVVWKTINEDIPRLRAEIGKLFDEEGWSIKDD